MEVTLLARHCLQCVKQVVRIESGHDPLLGREGLGVDGFGGFPEIEIHGLRHPRLRVSVAHVLLGCEAAVEGMR